MKFLQYAREVMKFLQDARDGLVDWDNAFSMLCTIHIVPLLFMLVFIGIGIWSIREALRAKDPWDKLAEFAIAMMCFAMACPFSRRLL